MACGKSALFFVACMALVNYSMGQCTISGIPADTDVKLDDTADVNTPILDFVITATTAISTFKPPVVKSDKQLNAFNILYARGDPNVQTMNVHIYTGQEFGNLVDINGELPTFTPAIEFNCDDDPLLLSTEFTITIADKNNQIPAFQADIPTVIHFDITKYNESDKPILGKFHVTDADSTNANNVVTVTKSAGTLDAVVVESSAGAGSQTEFVVKLNSPVEEGLFNVTLQAQDNGVDAADKPAPLSSYHTFQLYFTAPSSAIQQTGVFVMVTILSVVSAFVGKY